MRPHGILIFYHCRSNTGYAIGRLESIFYEMAQKLTGDINNVHLGYVSLDGGFPSFLAANFQNVIEFNPVICNIKSCKAIHDYIKDHNIELAFGFDQPVFRPVYSVMRKAGVRFFVSYWGAPISSINHGIRLFLKRMEVKLIKSKPDHFIFESQAMADLAVYGRGIGPRCISVVPTGVDIEIFKPTSLGDKFAHDAFGIPENRRIVFYSGHFEERKGVHVIIEAANELICVRKRSDVHFLLLGNMEGQEKKFLPQYSGMETEKYITFGGYREDVSRILPSCYCGVIASTGWDSFPMSSLEMMSSGLPLIASGLQGIVEQIQDGETGYLVEPGNHIDLADKIEMLLNNPELKFNMGITARRVITEKFCREKQIENLVTTIQKLY